MPNCGEAIVDLLKRYGVEHVFSIPGVHTVELYRGFASHGLTHVTPRHEQGAGFMAYGYAMATGRPGVCFVITGPGVANLATAMGEAYSESVPMLVIATNNALDQIGMGGGRLHETKSQMLLADQVTGSTHQVLAQRNIPSLLGRAFTRFDACRPRPVCIELPLNLLAEVAGFDRDVWPAPSRPAPDPVAIDSAAHVLARAERPIVLLGGGASDAAAEAVALCTLLDAPVVTTTSGKGVVSEDHELSVGASLPFQPIQDYLKRSDAVLAVGTEMAETDTLYTYTEYEVGPGLIRIDIEPEQLARNYRPRIGIVSDARLALAALRERLVERIGDARRAGGAAAAAALRSQLTGQWMEGAGAHKRVLDIMREALDDDAVVSAEECQLGYTACQYFRCRRPRTWIYPSGYGTLGPALPAAVGAKVGLPNRQVACISGDGSFLYTVGELAAAAELGGSLPIVIWNNRGYEEIARDMDRKGIERVGVSPEPPDFVQLAKGFRCHGERPGSLDEFRKAFEAALSAPKPTLIEMVADAAFLSD